MLPFFIENKLAGLPPAYAVPGGMVFYLFCP
jgi:hypothetical protein